MNPYTLSIDVIICTYTEARWKELTEAITSVQRQTLVANNIIVVVDHNPVLLQRIQESIPGVVVIENTGMHGLSSARNSGIAVAKSSIVVFLDDDAIAEPGWLRSLNEAFREKQVVGVGGAVAPNWRGKQRPWFPEEFLWVVGCTYRGMLPKGAIIRNPIGANMAFRRDVFHSAGGFRNEIGRIGTRPVGCEETELCIRIAQRWPQKKILYQPDASVLHTVSEQRATWRYFCSRCYFEGRSKAMVAQLVGTKHGLSSERSYILKALPLGVAHGLFESLLHGDVTGLLHAGAIVAGLSMTTLGYSVGSVLSRRVKPENVVSAKVQTKSFTPIRVLQIEIDQPLPGLMADDEMTNQHYGQAFCVICLHNYPLGIVEIPLTTNVTYGWKYAQCIWNTLGTQINEHLRQDGLPAVTSLEEICATRITFPGCVEEREQFYETAPFVSVVVCTHDRAEKLLLCVDSLLRLHYPRYEILLVDNAPSTSATAETVQRHYGNVARVRYVREDRAGLSLARNRGIEAAKGEIIAFTDDDVIVDRYWLLELIRGFSTSNVACVTGLILPVELETPAQYMFEKYGGFSKGFRQQTFDALNRHIHLYKAGLLGVGANMAFRASFLQNISGFDPALGAGSPVHSAEETAAFLQVIVSGYELIYRPAAMVYHQHRRDYSELCTQIYNYGVGFTAYVMKSLLEHPKLLLDLFIKVPYSLCVSLTPRSLQGEKKSSSPLQELTRIGRKGMLYGLLAYVRSRWAVHHTLDAPDQNLQATFKADYTPVLTTELELGQPIHALSTWNEKTGFRYRQVRCLVRLHRQPLGVVTFHTDEKEIQAHEIAHHIWDTLSTQINEHLGQDGLSTVSALNVAGVSSVSIPYCTEFRNQFSTDAPFASIILATRNRPELVATCVRSLLALQYPHYEIIIVDNAPSTSATAHLVQELYGNVPHVRYVRENRVGTCWARNRGIQVAKGEFIAFVDDDGVVDAHWLTALIKAFSVTERVVCVTGLVLPLELETPAQSWFEEYGGFNKGFNRQIFDMKTYHPKTPLHPYTAGRFGTGASVAFRASFLQKVGGFDPALGPGSLAQGGEDLALFFQVIKNGYRLVYEPTAVLYHLHRRTYASLRKQMYYYGVGLMAYLTKVLLDNPQLLLDFISKVPYGIFFTLHARSLKNSKKSSSYPQELTRLERKGMLYGPIAYIQSRELALNAHNAHKEWIHTYQGDSSKEGEQ